MKLKKFKKILAFVLAVTMLVGLVPVHTMPVEAKPKKPAKKEETQVQTQVQTLAETGDNTLETSLEEAKTYIDALTLNNSSNDPETIVKNFGKHFTWDNEKRESSKPYLFDWSYYNGVVFEGLEYVYEVTGEDVYKDYVIEYMSSLIASNGTWAACTNNSSKTCAGYDSTHGADCYKTASLLLDAYEMTGDSRYLTMAATLYADLDSAANSYSLSNAGNNYRHTWSSDPSPDLWLDGLYMILPFRAEYAKHINDTEELDLIVDRMQWVSDNMYNSNKKLFYHAADSASSNSGTYWLRSIGWYAAAIVDIMDSMEGENLEAMKAQLVKLVDGMKASQNSSNGMWLNNMVASQSSNNPYETSGTALVCYAVMKAVNEGWLDESYADMAVLAFKGICEEKLDGETLKDICFKGAPGSSNSTFYDNEGKGVGPFIMFYAEMLEYVNKDASDDGSGDTTEPETPVVPDEPEVPTPSTEEVIVEGTTTTITVGNIIGEVTASAVKESDKELIEHLVSEKDYADYVAYDINATLTEGTKALVSIPIPEEWNATEDELTGISVEDGEVKEIKGTLINGIYTFEVEHFSAKGVIYQAAPAADDSEVLNRGTGNLPGSTIYTLDTDGVDDGSIYLIVSNDNALRNNNGRSATQSVTTSNNTAQISNNEATSIWTFVKNGASWRIHNGNQYLRLNNNDILDAATTDLTVTSQGNGSYRIQNNRYLRFNNGVWERTRTSSNVQLYKQSYAEGETVTFIVNPATSTLLAGNALDLEYIITLGSGTEVDSETIEWKSENSSVAKVENGTVTANAEGTVNITATLRSVNGTNLVNPVTVTIPVTVANKKVTGAELTGNTPITIDRNVEPDFSGIQLKVTYDDGTTDTITVENGLVIEGYDVSKIGTYYATISYNGTEYGTIRVIVDGNPYEGLEETTDYPEYPADGAVRINKTATHSAEEFKNTGVTHVELGVAGISVKRGVDVVLVADISNSMAWRVGASGTSDADKIATGTQTTKWDEVQKAAETFIDTLFKGAEEETSPDAVNTISFVTFGGYDKERNAKPDNYATYADATQTHFTSYTNGEIAKAIINQLEIRGELSGSTVNYTITGMNLSNGAAQGGTNYDHAFFETAAAINQIKENYAASHEGASYDESGREIYVVFMTDGAPDHYNQLYYKTRKEEQFDYHALYKNSTDVFSEEYFKEHEVPDYTGYVQRQKPNGYYLPTSNMDNRQWIDWIQQDSLYAAEQVAKMEGVNSISAVGFDLENGGFGGFTFGEAVLEPVLKNLAGENSCEILLTSDTDEMNQFYANLAAKIRMAGTSAQVTDTIGKDFTLQTAKYSGSGNKTAELATPPSIKVVAYDLYAKTENAKDEDGNDLTGERKGTSTVIEEVRFNDDGTAAYSNRIDEGTRNIMSVAQDGTVVIEAEYFTYEKDLTGVETFEWKIGDITDKEITLKFDAYLKGALEGEAEQGIYYTNEEAVLEYIDINEKYAKQIFDVPHVNWGGASTTIRFYLVNKDGKPVNHAGDVVPWANRIYVGEPVNVHLNLNADLTIPAYTIEAAAYVPGEYFLYDHEAEYTVQTASGQVITGGITVADPSMDASKVTYDKNGNPVQQSGAQTTRVIDFEEIYYTWSVVGFGVRYDLSKEEITPLDPDTIVMDYGKDIQVNVLENDKDVVPEGWSAELVGFVKYNSNTDVKYIQANAGSPTYAGASEYGQFSIADGKTGKVNYTPTKMLPTVQKVFCAIKFTEINNPSNVHYRYNVLNIIPATSVYYETGDDAGNKLFGITTTETEWSKATVTDDKVSDGPQDEGTIGQNLYGFDSSYKNDKYLSNGSSLKAIGQGVKVTTAKFSFSGTGFDLISRTGAEQGAIRVDIFSDAARTTLVKSITVLNKSESNLELYQIPVVSAELDTYGTYYVTVGVNAALDASTLYPDLNLSQEVINSLSRGGEFFFDAIRVYNPISSKDADYEMVMNAYAADGEANMERKEIRAMLIGDEGEILGSIEEDENGEEIDVEGVVFVDRTCETDESGNVVETGVGLADYTAIGPNNEVYLTGSQAIGFGISVDPANLPTSIDIGAKSVHGENVTLHATVYVGDAENESVEVEQEIASGTAQNFDLLAGNAVEKILGEKTELYVIIDNLGEGILSLTDLKIAYGDRTSNVSVFANRTVLEKTVQYVEGPSETVSCDVLSAEFTKESIKRNAKATLEVVTDEAVESLVIKNKAGKEQSFDVKKTTTSEGTKVWTIQYKITSTGTQTYTIEGYDENGNTGATATASIKVTR